MLLISRSLLATCVAAARAAHPRESILLLHGRREGADVLLESASIPPGLSVARSSAAFLPWMVPTGMDYIGVFHSHSSGGARPSEEDLFLASSEGGVQLLLASPYAPAGLVAYDPRGRKLEYRIIE